MKWKQIISEVDLDIKPERANEGKHFAIWGGGVAARRQTVRFI